MTFMEDWLNMIVATLRVTIKILYYIFTYPVPMWFSTVLLVLLFYTLHKYDELKIVHKATKKMDLDLLRIETIENATREKTE